MSRRQGLEKLAAVAKNSFGNMHGVISRFLTGTRPDLHAPSVDTGANSFGEADLTVSEGTDDSEASKRTTAMKHSCTSSREGVDEGEQIAFLDAHDQPLWWDKMTIGKCA